MRLLKKKKERKERKRERKKKKKREKPNPKAYKGIRKVHSRWKILWALEKMYK